MKAYNIAMFCIFVNAATLIVTMLGIFPAFSLTQNAFYGWFINTMTSPIATVFVYALVGASAVLGILGGASPSGLSIGQFSIIFWGSLAVTMPFFVDIALHFPFLSVFLSIFALVQILAFYMTYIQMTTSGGQQSYV